MQDLPPTGLAQASPRRRAVLASTLAAAIGLPATGRAQQALPLGFAPNIVFLMTDDGPRDSYDAAAKGMPVLSQRYLGHWLSYPNASCNDPLCAPGRAATLSGLVSQHHGVLDNQTGQHLRLDRTWLAALQQAGYLCGGYGKLINGWGVDFGSTTQIPPGFDDFHMLVSDPGYFNYVLNDNGTPTTYGQKDTNAPGTDYLTDVSRIQILDFITQTHRDQAARPWAVYWAPNAPHRDAGTGPLPAARYGNAPVVVVDPPHFNSGAQAQMPWLGKAQKKYPLDVQAIHKEHTAALRALLAVNEGLKAIMDLLSRLGILEQTVIVVATDNSHMYGAYGLQDKGTSFEDALNYLLRIRYPGAPDGEQRLQAVSNIDIAPFLCELAGATMPGQVDGQSFVASLLNAKAPFREAAPICHAKDGPGTPTFDGLRFADRKLAVGRAKGSADGEQWAHNLLTDPWELRAVAPSAKDLKKLQKVLDSF
jgi:arylsulfatase A-like enzyme